jgi:cation:H+ antiporter
LIIYLEAIAGLLLLLGGGDVLVRGAVDLARRGNLPPMFIGLTIVAFGTSAPELMTSLQATLSGLPSIAIGNVVGSNIANILLVLGLPALITPIACNGHGLWRTTLIMIAATVGVIIVSFTGTIGFVAGALFFMLLVLFLVISTTKAVKGRGEQPALVDLEALEAPMLKLPTSVAFTIGGIVGLVLGAHLLVEGGAAIAANLGVPDAVIGLSLVAIGTSLPELATSISAALRRHADVLIGNVIGSNLFNLLAIIGITSMAHPITVAPHFLQLDMWVMLGSSAVLLPVIWKHGRISRLVGGLFLLAYIIYIGNLSNSWAGATPVP